MSSAGLLTMGVLMTLGAGLGALVRRLGIPRVSGYVLAGIALSPELLGGPLGIARGEWTAPLTSACLGVIAYLIGGSLTVDQLRRQGRLLLLATLGQGLGSMLGVRLAGAPFEVGFELGLALLPQAGVAIGLALRCAHVPGLEEVAPTLLNVVLAATVIHELVGPLAAQGGFRHAGELRERSEEVFR